MKANTNYLTRLILIFSTAFVIVSCKTESNNDTSKSSETEKNIVKATPLNGLKTVDLNTSKVYWKGYKLIGNHTGTIDLSEGELSFDNGNVTSGQFVVDMNTVKVTELMDDGEEEEEEDESPEDDKSDLANHLMNADFFDTQKFPTASFVITKSKYVGNNYQMIGNMTIKGVTNEVSFQSQLNDNIFTAIIPIDRTQFGVKYGSGSFFSNLGDNVIKDKFDLLVTLKMK